MPDVADLERLKVLSGFNNERLQIELASILAGCGQRAILEMEVSKSVQEIYQDGATWIKKEDALCSVVYAL